MAVKILNGADPGKIPISAPQYVGYALNLKIAKRMGIVFSPDVIREADEVYK